MPANHIPDSDPIADSSPKRRKLYNGYAATGTYDPEDDSGDDLFNDYETVATLPIVRPHISFDALKAQMSSPPPHVTQSTQILATPISRKAGVPPVIQVAASSPLARSSPAPPRFRIGNAMAPPGTFFRRPVDSAIPRPIDLDLEDPPVEHSSGDEASRSRSNIKPSIFSSGGRSHTNNGSSSSFKGLTSQFMYNGGTNGSSMKRPVDDMASAYAGSHRRPQKLPRQTGPARAQAVQEELTLDDIPDAETRKKIEWLSIIIPNKSIRCYRDALAAKRGNYSDALEYLTEMDEKEAKKTTVDLTMSEDELAGTAQPVRRPVLPAKTTAKRAVQAPARTIQEKWSSTQVPSKTTPPTPASAVPTPVVSSPSALAATPPKPRRRLLKGRRRPSPPEAPSATSSVTVSAAPSPQPIVTARHKIISLDSDEDPTLESGSEAGGVVDDGALETKVLNFFNTCSLRDLADISNSTEEVAGAILAERPFKNLEQVRAVSIDTPDAAPTKSARTTKRRSTKRPVGDRIVDICLEMLTGYEAVDELVNYCETLGKPILATIKRWGSNVYGDSQRGEVELLSLDDAKSESDSMRDSGIGTPSSSSPEDTDGDLRALANSNKKSLLKQPAIMSKDLVMKDYQIVGLNWLNLLWSKRLSCILADEMGLGKTCQVISFISHLYEIGVSGPHLVIVPGSTLENWLREFRNFSPRLVVEPYYGLQAEREQQRADIEHRRNDINVIVTTYDIAGKEKDNKFLRKDVKPVVCVYDEGHKLKNSATKTYKELMRIPAQFRLLLTGTPLQNNLQELVSLLAFIMPDLFRQRQDDLACVFKHKAKTTDADHAALLSAQRIARARSMITPFILRRKKDQVLKHLPRKRRRVEYCELTESQRVIYDELRAQQRRILEDRLEGRPNTENANFMPDLRKAAIHPLLFRNVYTDSIVEKIAKAGFRDEGFRKDKEFKNLKDFGPETISWVLMEKSDFWLHRFCQKYPARLSKYELEHQEWMDSGKVQKLVSLLQASKANGDRTLVFSQMTENGLDLLEAALDTISMPYFRLDGSTPMAARQDMIDAFHKDESVPVFLLTTKAGGAGINLACANRVVIFDSSFNPQDDVQAENRAHRVGQTREVEVVRLISRGTIEEQIYALGVSKLALDDRVAGEGVAEDEAKGAEADGAAMVEKMMMEELKKEKEGDGPVAGAV